MGRPRKAVGLKIAQGDTRNVGALVFRDECAQLFVARSGAPPTPEDFKIPRLSAELREDPKAIEKHKEMAERCRMARAHWDYLMRHLAADNLLRESDQGILAGMAWAYALRSDAARRGAASSFATLDENYRASSNLVGLNESARAKFPKQSTAQTMSAEESALAGGLPDDAQPVQ